MSRKYRFSQETKKISGKVLHRILAIKDFSDVKAGDLGGWVEKISNLDQYNDCWVYGNAWVLDNAKVSDDAVVKGNAEVSGNAKISGNVVIKDDSLVEGDVTISEDVVISCNAWIHGNAKLDGKHNIGLNADIERSNDVFSVRPVGVLDDTMTFYKADSGTYVNFKIEEFNDDIRELEKIFKLTKEYSLAIKLGKLKVEGDRKNNMSKKYKLTEETKQYNGKILHRIEALRDFRDVRAGDLGGWVEGEHNLSQEGDCWVYDESMVLDNARIEDSAFSSWKSIISENAKIKYFSMVTGNAEVFGNAQIIGKVVIYGNAQISGNTIIPGNEKIGGEANIKDSNDFSNDCFFCSDLTFYKTDNGIFVTAWGDEYSLDEFEELTEKKYKKSVLDTYRGLIKSAKLKIKL